MFPNDLSFDPRDPAIPLPRSLGTIGLQIFTTDHVYGLPADTTVVDTAADGSLVITAPSLTWAGQQQHSAGSARLVITPDGAGVRVVADAAHGEPIKALKLVLRHLPAAVAAGFWQATSPPGSARRARPLDPLLWRYPWPADDPWPEWETPWAAAGPGPDGETLTISVRAPERAGRSPQGA